MPSGALPRRRRIGEKTTRIRGTVLLAVATTLATLAGGPADARAGDDLPTYRTPGYQGTRTAPATRPAPPPPPVVLGQGERPDLVVDEAGTAHVVWNEPGGDQPDVLRYCRLPRGGSACERTHALVPDQPYGEGGGPDLNDDVSGPRVLALGDDVAVLTFRYPIVTEKPGRDASSSSLYLSLSDDGGESFSAPVLVGDLETSGDAIAFPFGEGQAIAVTTDTKTGGTFIQVIRPGSFPPEAGNLGDGGPDQAYSGSLAVDQQGRPVAAFSDLDPAVHVRRWTGTGDPQDPETWTREASFPGAEPRLASGPSGVFVLHRTDLLGPYQLRRLQGDGGVGSPVRVSTTQDEASGAFFQDAGGRLLAGWVDPQAEPSGSRLLVRRSADGRAFDPPFVLGADQGGQVHDLELGATFDGGGFGTWVQGASAVGQVTAAAFGTASRTGRPGLGARPGGGREPGTVLECQGARFGVVRITVAEGCLLATRDGGGARVSEGPLRLNGLDIVPDAGVRIILNARARTLDTTGDVRVLLRGSGIGEITLWHGELHIRLPTAGAGTLLASFDTNRFASVLKGFPIKGRIDVELRQESVRIPVALGLPRVFGDIRGEAVLQADSRNGLRLESLFIKVANALIGPVELQDLQISYAREGEIWDGRAALGLPPRPTRPALSARVRFEGGAFRRGEMTLTFPFPGVKIAPGVFVTRVGAGFGLEPLEVEGTVRVGALPIGGGRSVVDLDGAVRASFPSGRPARFEVEGRASLLGVGLAEARALFQTDGYLEVRGGYDLDLEVVSIKGGLLLVVDGPAEQFAGEIDSEICLKVLVELCGRAGAIVSSKGIGACYEVRVRTADGRRLLRLVTARRRFVRIARVPRRDRWSVTVTGLTGDGLAGPPRRARG